MKAIEALDRIEAYLEKYGGFSEGCWQSEHDIETLRKALQAMESKDTITLTREELEGMKVNNHISDSEYNMALKDGHNYAIDAILEKMG